MLRASVRGAALAETVSVLGFILALLFGSAQLVLTGFYQLQLDAATFFYAHNYALTGVATAPAPSAVPVVPPGVLKYAASDPPNTSASDANGLSVLGEYTTGGVPGGNPSATGERFGGASLIEPAQIASTGILTLPSFDLSIFGGSGVQISAGSIEGQSMVANHDDDSTGDPYTAAAGYGSLRNPTAAYASNGDDQNVPPYYMNMAYMFQCVGFNCNGATQTNGDENEYALGLAEYLMDDSYAGAGNGNYDNSANGIGVGQMFGAMTQHQQIYADIAQKLQSGVYAFSGTGANSMAACVNALNSWDVVVQGQGAVSPSGSDYGTQYPTHPLAPIVSC